MIRNPTEVERAQRMHRRMHQLTLAQKRAILNAMYEEVKQLGRLHVSVDRRRKHKIAMARILNAGV